MVCNGRAEILEFDGRQGRASVVGTRAEHQFCADVASDTAGKISRGGVVDGNDNDASEETAEKRDDPFGGILAPKKHGIALLDAAAMEFAGDPVRLLCDLGIGPRLHAIATTLADGNLTAAGGVTPGKAQ